VQVLQRSESGSNEPEQRVEKNHMDVLKMLADLRQEREQIEEAIMTLERLARGRGRRRGRPPAWMTAIKRRGRPPGSKNKPKVATAA
jgi:DNA invertase Pin-like site-specific DNA recombinase